MPDHDLSPAEIAELFGGEAKPIKPDADELAVVIALRTIRDHLMAAAEKDGVGVSKLAKRLDVSPSAVSRALGGEGDIRLSTAVLYARALGRSWEFHLNEPASREGQNYSAGAETLHIIAPDRATAFTQPAIKEIFLNTSRAFQYETEVRSVP